MATRRDFVLSEAVPDIVIRQVQRHLLSACSEAEQRFSDVMHDEDRTTGFLSGKLDGEGTMRIVVHGPQGGLRVDAWKWEIRSKAFSSHGDGAVETVLGADGIVEVMAVDRSGRSMFKKGLLFQAKKDDNADNARLRRQIHQMEDVAPNGSALFEYAPTGYRAWHGREVAKDQQFTTRRGMTQAQPLGRLLSEDLLQCKVGRVGMEYDPSSETLWVPVKGEPPRPVAAHVSERIRVVFEQLDQPWP